MIPEQYWLDVGLFLKIVGTGYFGYLLMRGAAEWRYGPYEKTKRRG